MPPKRDMRARAEAMIDAYDYQLARWRVVIGAAFELVNRTHMRTKSDYFTCHLTDLVAMAFEDAVSGLTMTDGLQLPSGYRMPYKVAEHARMTGIRWLIHPARYAELEYNLSTLPALISHASRRLAPQFYTDAADVIRDWWLRVFYHPTARRRVNERVVDDIAEYAERKAKRHCRSLDAWLVPVRRLPQQE